MVKTGSFDLLSRRKPGWKPEAVLIVSPYVEKEFFLRIARDLRPKRIHVVIDDGCRREDKRTVIEALKEGGHKRDPFIKLGSARGLVHMKLVYVRWTTPGGRTAHHVVFGSANATRQGFSGVDNAELVAGCSLTAKSHAGFIRWCERAIEATHDTEARRVPAADGDLFTGKMLLRLPEITIGRDVAAVGDFDLWVQHGSLLSPYRPDPSFLRVSVPLSKPLRQGEQQSVAAGVGFEVAQTKSVVHRYIDDGSRAGDAGPTIQDIGNWRRKLFTWTHLGEWCSEQCYVAHHRDFKRRKHRKRQAALTRLQAFRDVAARAKSRDEFLTKMDALWTAFGDEAAHHLRGSGSIDRRHYGKVFDERVARDLDFIEDEEFALRYVDGYELVPVPRFRDDLAGWRNFVESLGRQLVLDETRGRSQSRLLAAIREAVRVDDRNQTVLQEPRALIAFLRETLRGDIGRNDGPAAAIFQYHRS